MKINLGLGFSDPDIRPGLDNRHLIIEGHIGLRKNECHGRSWKVDGWSSPITGLKFQMKKLWVG